MGSATKITLSDKELSLVTNADWILTKQIIIEKVYQLFATIIPEVKLAILNESSSLHAEIKSSTPKISKGENYRKLPYMMLDYPRCFNREDIFAVRTMFWWANFFSITLHVSGKYTAEVKKIISKNKSRLTNNFFVGVNENQWEHHFEADNFLLYNDLSPLQQLKLFEENNFIKLALKFDLHQWNDIPALLNEGYNKIAGLLS